MRYFVDAEFNGFGGALVAFAAVPEDDNAPPFYEAVICDAPDPWVEIHVLPVLQTTPRPLIEVATLFSSYLHGDRQPIIVADWPEDIAHAAALLTNRRGRRLYVSPVEFQLLGSSTFNSHRLSQTPHNAYNDAVALRDWVRRKGL
ncbi:MAG: hypothetical protein JWM33_4008 [Caulobacteraceae bacterium]|nr:hypothetical protein [Caulobacteraceae bacterium]